MVVATERQIDRRLLNCHSLKASPMPAENWESLFRESLIGRAHAVAADLRLADPDAEARGRSFAALLASRLYCPECWVRYGQAATLHRARWLLSCGEHHYKVR